MTNYDRGVRLVERPTVYHLTEDGYRHVRGAGSKGFADVVCTKPGQLLYISCKLDGKLPQGQWDDLVEVSSWNGAIPLLAVRDLKAGCARRHREETRETPTLCRIRFVELTGRKIHRAPADRQNWRPWTSDLVVPA